MLRRALFFESLFSRERENNQLLAARDGWMDVSLAFFLSRLMPAAAQEDAASTSTGPFQNGRQKTHHLSHRR